MNSYPGKLSVPLESQGKEGFQNKQTNKRRQGFINALDVSSVYIIEYMKNKQCLHTALGIREGRPQHLACWGPPLLQQGRRNHSSYISSDNLYLAARQGTELNHLVEGTQEIKQNKKQTGKVQDAHLHCTGS